MAIRVCLAKDEPGLFLPQHLVRADATQAETDTRVWNLDLLERIGGNLVGDDDIVMRQRMSDEPAVGHLQKLENGCRIVVLDICPIADPTESAYHGTVRRQKELVAEIIGLFRQLVISRTKLIRDLFDAR